MTQLTEHVTAVQTASNAACKRAEQDIGSVQQRVTLLEKVARNAAIARSNEQQQQ